MIRLEIVSDLIQQQVIINKKLAVYNIIAQIKYDNNITDKAIHLEHKDKKLDGERVIAEAGLVDDSLL